MKQLYIREILLCLTIMVDLLYYCAVVSYNPVDPSLFSVAYPIVPPTNLIGSWGAQISAIALYYFGWVAYLLPIPFAIFMTLLYFQRTSVVSTITNLGMILGLWGSTLGLSITVKDYLYQNMKFFAGGRLGEASKLFLIDKIGFTGTVIFTITALVVSALFILQRSLWGQEQEPLPSLKEEPIQEIQQVKSPPIATIEESPQPICTVEQTFENKDEPRFEDALQIAKFHGMVSPTFLQRQLKVSYGRATEMVELMENRGLVSKPDGLKPRKWLGDNAIEIS